ncbi:M48 family metalloprotease [Infirmifilum lucidum]|uniref:Protease HtpX homolog n=1 Tax=Infirmifilum lucidum TaxID=2776706 RepID=A0A7L9FI25_9CREN|nr:zinc metalloprotease HtpX [Infirmifilum lucidum]QOJ79440.1 M48 family metalloprotease [Infirmifilum lucidum]
MALEDLKLSMILTLAFIFGLTTLAFVFLLDALGLASPLVALILALIFNVGQWLVSPYLVEFFYHVRELPYHEAPHVHQALEEVVSKSGLREKPKLMIAEVPYPNAFAYGSPLTGNRVAVTRGLLEALNKDEIAGVLGHEVGHIVHRDVQVMTLVSVLPAFFYILGRMFLYSKDGGDRDRSGAIALGFLSLLIYFILSLANLHLSRIREYYADYHSVKTAPSPRAGAARLMSALAKIVNYTGRLKAEGAEVRVAGFKELFIADPDSAVEDMEALEGYRLAKKIAEGKVTLADRILELFSTHPNIVERLRRLEELGRYEKL